MTGQPAGALYAAVWRWHFFAGLIVLPFLILMAITGGLYLFKDEINLSLYRDLMVVEPGAAQPAAALVAAALAAHPGDLARYQPPAPGRAAEVTIVTGQGKRTVYVDPKDARVLGDLADGGFANSPVMLFIRKVHSLNQFGWIANRVIEIVTGWCLILVGTGLYLWWPRGQRGGVVAVRGTPGKRVFWRDLHAVGGLTLSSVIVFLVVSGMPWSGFWGAHMNRTSDQAGLGYPPEYWDNVPQSTVPMGEALDRAPWALEQVGMPASTPSEAAPIGLDRALAIFDGLGIAAGYRVEFPDGPTGVYTAAVYPDQIAGERIIHLDQYSGAVLFDGGWADLGPVGAAVEWTTSIHMGQEFGLANQLILAAGCLGLVVMSVAAAVMWWKRRPAGSLGVPPVPADARVPRFILALAIVVGVIFPLVGASLVLALALDFAWPRAPRELA